MDLCKRVASSIELNGLKLQVRIGYGAEERAQPQTVRFDLKLRFPKVPHGCQTDQLKDTVCYAKMANLLEGVCQQREYALIERLTWEAFEILKKEIPDDVLLSLRVTKERPPVPGLTEGATFSLGEWDAI